MNLKVAKVISLVTLLVISISLAHGIAQASPTTKFVVEPPITVTHLEPGSSFWVDVHVLEAVDIYAWQVYMEWDPDVLTATDVTFGDFLQDQPEGSEVFSKIEQGYLLVAETTIGQYLGKDAPIATLFSVGFSVESSGYTALDISGGEEDLTYYISSADFPEPIPRYPITENGHFINVSWWLILLILILLLLGIIP